LPTVSLGYLPRAEAGKLKIFMANPAAASATPSAAPEILTLIHTPNDTIARVEPATLAAASDFFTTLVMKLDGELE